MPTAETALAADIKRETTQGRSSWIIATVSVLLLVPCVWQAHIESTDLATHVYNAWLARLIPTQQLPGLWMNHQVTNVVFDYLLTCLRQATGVHGSCCRAWQYWPMDECSI